MRWKDIVENNKSPLTIPPKDFKFDVAKGPLAKRKKKAVKDNVQQPASKSKLDMLR